MAARGGLCRTIYRRIALPFITSACGRRTARGNVSMIRCGGGCDARRDAGRVPAVRSATASRRKRPNRAGLAATTGEKKLVGRKRHAVVDTLGLLWALVITPASVQDRDGGKLALEQFRDRVKFPKVIWADTAYHATARWAGVLWNWYVEIVTRPRGRFEIQHKRWIVERTFGSWNRSRRLAKCYERTTESEQAFILVTMIHLMARRLGCVSKH